MCCGSRIEMMLFAKCSFCISVVWRRSALNRESSVCGRKLCYTRALHKLHSSDLKAFDIQSQQFNWFANKRSCILVIWRRSTLKIATVWFANKKCHLCDVGVACSWFWRRNDEQRSAAASIGYGRGRGDGGGAPPDQQETNQDESH